MPRLTEQGHARREFIRKAVERGDTDVQIFTSLVAIGQPMSIDHLRKMRRLYGVRRGGGRPANWTDEEIAIVRKGAAEGLGNARISASLWAAGFKRTPHGVGSMRRKKLIVVSRHIDLAKKYEIVRQAFAAGKTDVEIGELIGKRRRTVKAMRSKLRLFRENFDLRQVKHATRFQIKDWGPNEGDYKFVAAMKAAIRDGHERVKFGIFKDSRPLGPPTLRYLPPGMSMCGSSAAWCADHGDKHPKGSLAQGN